jgi:hypothetical protein
MLHCTIAWQAVPEIETRVKGRAGRRIGFSIVAEMAMKRVQAASPALPPVPAAFFHS